MEKTSKDQIREIMKDYEQKLKMQLLEKLMGEMDEHSSKKLKKDEPKVEVTEIEQKELPVSELKEMMTEKMQPVESEELEIQDEDEDDEFESDFMKKVKAAKNRKLME